MEKKRIFVLLISFLVFFVLIIARLFELQILHHSFYERKSTEQRTRLINLAAQRGDIFDRNNNILATSIDTYSVYLHRKGWLARKLPLAKAAKLKAEHKREASLLREKKRIYPKQRLAAQLLGFVGLDNQGLSGLELSFDEYLRGKEGKVITEGDPAGRELYGALRELEPGEDGMNVTLTIDENIQYVAEREIAKQIKRFGAISGMCIVMDAKTGEILALASKPDFNPNSYQQSNKKLWHPRVVDPYEPGSTFKVITVAAALEEGVISTETMLKSQDSIVVGGKVIENAHEVEWPGSSISISKMVEESINTGSVQVGLKLGKEKFHNKLMDFGFGRRTGFGLWGESKGIVRHWRKWYKPDIAMITFGQTIAVTPLQLMSAVSAFANAGRMVKPLLVKKIESIDGKFIKVFAQRKSWRPVSEKVAAEVKQLMRNVVLRGTGRPASIKGFGVCGKTGTAQKAIPGGKGYLKDRYIASFIGFAPFDNPRLICLVLVDDPKGAYWGATVAGPVFKSVMEYSLRYLNVKPDLL
ncbi:peptidoglycan D,D-transpeptidase FtsI family protein [Candidatus Margulisiibacteriota bacterium]